MSDNATFGPSPRPEELTGMKLFNVTKSLAKLDAAIRIFIADGSWPQTRQEAEQAPQLLHHLIGTTVIGIDAQGMSEAGREQALRAVAERIHHITDLLGIDRVTPAKHLAVADRRDRREIWKPLLESEARYVRWPEPIRQHFVSTVVGIEADMINAYLEQQWKDTSESLGSWEWDPSTATAVHDGGSMGPFLPPPIEQMLAAAFEVARGNLEDAERVAVMEWLEEQITVLRDRDWIVNKTETSKQLDPTWTIDHARQRLHLHTPPLRWAEWDENAVARMSDLATVLGELTAAPTDPVTIAYPQTTPNVGVDQGTKPSAAAIAPTEGPVR